MDTLSCLCHHQTGVDKQWRDMARCRTVCSTTALLTNGRLVIFNSLLLLTALSYTVAISRRPLRPDQSAAPPDARPLLPDEVCEPIDGGRPGIRRESRSSGSHDDDDIPLRLLANGRSQINSTQQRLPLNHRDQSPTSAKRDEDDEDDDYDDAAENQALLKSEATDRNQVHTPIMAKGATGGPRWCRKCNGWKPDRCHHCRSCRQCVLKSGLWTLSLTDNQWITTALGWETVWDITTVKQIVLLWLTCRQSVHSLPHIRNVNVRLCRLAGRL